MIVKKEFDYKVVYISNDLDELVNLIEEKIGEPIHLQSNYSGYAIGTEDEEGNVWYGGCDPSNFINETCPPDCPKWDNGFCDNPCERQGKGWYQWACYKEDYETPLPQAISAIHREV